MVKVTRGEQCLGLMLETVSICHGKDGGAKLLVTMMEIANSLRELGFSLCAVVHFEERR